MKFIKEYFRKREIKQLTKKIARLQMEALHHQRNGKLRLYASILQEVETLSDKLANKIDNEKLSYEPPPNDLVDYDGMGNQGRFPEAKKN